MGVGNLVRMLISSIGRGFRGYQETLREADWPQREELREDQIRRGPQSPVLETAVLGRW